MMSPIPGGVSFYIFLIISIIKSYIFIVFLQSFADCLSPLSAWQISPRPPRSPWPRGPPRARRRERQRWKRCKCFLADSPFSFIQIPEVLCLLNLFYKHRAPLCVFAYFNALVSCVSPGSSRFHGQSRRSCKYEMLTEKILCRLLIYIFYLLLCDTSGKWFSLPLW